MRLTATPRPRWGRRKVRQRICAGGRHLPWNAVPALFLAGSLLAACSGTGPAQQSPSSGAELAVTAALPTNGCGDSQPGRYFAEVFDVQQVSTVGYSDGLLADVYQPADDPAQCRVAVVWVHGGGFTQASRNGPAEQAWGMALAARGYVAVLIDYRLGQGEPFGLDQAAEPSRAEVVSNAILDAQSALRWVRTAASDLRVDPGRIAIGGTSAGAMTAAGAALTSPAGDRPCTLVSISGDIEAAWVGADPISALFVHGDTDQLVPYESAVSAVQLITRNGGDARLDTIAGAGHEITGVPAPDMVPDVAAWLREHTAARCG